ncbi:NTP transferase domain-containing protein [archaeon]|jgi:UDP-N-acetylglucosamine diphosphorylase / glucose-1-phosphate thymidylyltransferase / UDP-N-acetylgalactosamine diphosphorylase / glucosamine-1-phosphate N-acetyltransferase / galactosamine-1-phosphate N-acetyltransferase|nr:NTP transferase domain-containing protein [archaeon]MBT3451079.1 NTP transferase domain-containing protein [archaeon]MBT6869465.1 NTP transferase domain-containing protein [archaeon]MBT7193153.1 NTP transferase domain-containing protein [archaeon]MBT7380459.1 NTP transferase domain-containing protein [archaeon]
MQAVILAAGKGSRIYPFSEEKPKPLVEVANKPVLEHNLDQMLGIIDEVIIVVGYKKDMIIERIGDQYHNIKIKYVVQEEQLGTGHAVAVVENEIKNKFLVINGDDLFSRKDMINVTKFENCILLKQKNNVSAFGVAVVKEGKVVDLVEKPKEPISNLVNVGMYCFNPEIFEVLRNIKRSERGEYEITDAIKYLAFQGKMHYQEVQGYWIPVGYPWQILEATEAVLEDDDSSSSIKGKVEEGVIIEGSVDIGENSVVKSGTLLKGNIVIGNNCVIGENSMLIGYTAIANDCIIGSGCGIENSIVGEGSNLGNRCAVKDSVLGEGVELSEGVRIENMGGTGASTIKIKTPNKELDSGRKKLGAFVADQCKVCKSLNPGDCLTKDCDGKD